MTVEYACLVVPLMLALTIFSAHPLQLNAVIYGCIALLYVSNLAPSQSRTFHTSPSTGSERSYQHKRTASTSEEVTNRYAGQAIPASYFQKPFATVWRAHMMLMTVICILAVDFPVFPRIFGKCESWGTSIVRP